jgi:hypothetical protein
MFLFIVIVLVFELLVGLLSFTFDDMAVFVVIVQLLAR